jgi:hypothetical protein
LIDSNGIADGASIAFYLTGTTTPSTIYSDVGLTTPLTNPVVVGAGAAVPSIYLSDAVTYRRVITYADGSTDDTDPYTAPYVASAELAASGGSALVGFLQSGTGAVARTAQAKMRDVVSVKDFGATGDGVTDDSAAIQAAVDAHRAVHFPLGSYNIGSTTITVAKTCKLHGDANSFGDTTSVSRLVYTGTGVALDIVPSSGKIYNAQVENLGIQASGGATSSATAVGIRLVNSNYGVLQNVTVQGFASGTGVKLTATSGQIGASNSIIAPFIWGNKIGLSVEGAAAGSADYATTVFGGAIIGFGSPYPAGSKGIYTDTYAAELRVYGTDIESFEFLADLNGGGSTSGGGHQFFGGRFEFYTTNAVRINAGTEKVSLIGCRFSGGSSATWVGDSGTRTFRTDVDANVRLNVASLEILNNIPLNMQDSGGTARQVLKLASNDTVQFGTASGNGNYGLGSWHFTSPTVDSASGASGYLNPLWLGSYALWVDSTGALRIKSSAPASDTDGTVVGTQT